MYMRDLSHYKQYFSSYSRYGTIEPLYSYVLVQYSFSGKEHKITTQKYTPYEHNYHSTMQTIKMAKEHKLSAALEPVLYLQIQLLELLYCY